MGKSIKICAVTSCGGKHDSRGLCRRHYEASKRIGTTDQYPKNRIQREVGLSLEESIQAIGWDVDSKSNYWIWRGSRTSEGYGQLGFDRKIIKAHRAAYTSWKGPIPRGMVVRHSCDVRLCINPSHLSYGTIAENNQDMRDRGRHFHGERASLSKDRKLNPNAVREIRHMFFTGEYSQTYIASQFGVTQKAISDIVKRATWKHVS